MAVLKHRLWHSSWLKPLQIRCYAVQDSMAKKPAFSVKAIKSDAQILEDGAKGVTVKNNVSTLLPYYAWNHRVDRRKQLKLLTRKKILSSPLMLHAVLKMKF